MQQTLKRLNNKKLKIIKFIQLCNRTFLKDQLTEYPHPCQLINSYHSASQQV